MPVQKAVSSGALTESLSLSKRKHLQEASMHMGSCTFNASISILLWQRFCMSSQNPSHIWFMST
eukprot:5116012-Karenia_brevis.AAC.1